MPRLAIAVHGTVQGVGFRPFVHRCALEHGLVGWVRNEDPGVRIAVQGEPARLRAFVRALVEEAPAGAAAGRLEVVETEERAEVGFRIDESAPAAAGRLALAPDLATCADCLREVGEPGARRYRYPFTTCARCGPRLTLVEALPYDRVRTAMRAFPPCARCRAEYLAPADRRHHAETIACPACGPQVALLAPDGSEAARGEGALEAAARALRDGLVVALKGLGGYQLLVSALDERAVARLRRRKRRPDKPLAVMFASLDALRDHCRTTAAEELVLASAAAPIVLVRRRVPAPATGGLASGVAPAGPLVGALLPTTPLHHLLARAAARPLVCTSGNRSDEPICVEEPEALRRLTGIADHFLTHDRPILRPVDDSVVRVWGAAPRLLRRARGFAPTPHPLPDAVRGLLALGGHLKGAVAVARDGEVIVSQHLGDLGTAAGLELLERTVGDLLRLCGVHPEVVACDLHPDYTSSRVAERLAAALGVPLLRVQHHHAHVAACVAEHGVEGPVLGLAWDGAGLGADGALWGGEALACEGAGYRRVAHLRPFRLPGGPRALREPRRAALGLLHARSPALARRLGGSWFAPGELGPLLTLLERGVGSPETTSVGRLFDAVAALLGVRSVCTFEGQAAMELELLDEPRGERPPPYPLPLVGGEPAIADWGPLLDALLDDRARGVPAPVGAARLHGALAALAVAIARRAGLPAVALGGGCFQSARLAGRVEARLLASGVRVWVPRRFPPNDGGLALGQALVAARWLKGAGHVPRHPG